MAVLHRLMRRSITLTRTGKLPLLVVCILVIVACSFLSPSLKKQSNWRTLKKSLEDVTLPQPLSTKVFSTSRRFSRKTKDPLPAVDPNGYVTYLPHSGFSNQRLELENALSIAYALNRTLIMPPLYMGHDAVISWREFPNMQFQLRQVESTNYNRLFFSDEVDPVLREFLMPGGPMAVLPWNAIFDVKKLQGRIKTISIADFVDLQLLKRLEDVFLIPDYERYAYRIVDQIPGGNISCLFDNDNSRLPLLKMEDSITMSMNERDKWFVLNMTLCRLQEFLRFEVTSGFYDVVKEQWHFVKREIQNTTLADRFVQEHHYLLNECEPKLSKNVKVKPVLPEIKTAIVDKGKTKVVQIPVGKHSHIVNLESLQQLKAPLIQFGSLFGKNRLEFLLNKNKPIPDYIAKAFVHNNQHVMRAGNQIIKKLGGAGRYIALHVRVGDGHFRGQSEKTVAAIVNILKDWSNDASVHKFQVKGKYPLIYIATDCPKDQRGLFKPIQALAHRLSFLDDFTSEVEMNLGQLDKWRESQLKNISTSWESEMTLLFDAIELLSISKKKTIQFETGQSQNKRFTQMARFLLNQQKKSRKTSFNTAISGFSQLWIPFVEQVVCSRAFGVVGTKTSTFSDFVERLYRIYWTEKNPSKKLFAAQGFHLN